MSADDIVTVEARLIVKTLGDEVLLCFCLGSDLLKMGSISCVDSLGSADTKKKIIGSLTQLLALAVSQLQNNSEPAGPFLLTTYKNTSPDISSLSETWLYATPPTMENSKT